MPWRGGLESLLGVGDSLDTIVLQSVLRRGELHQSIPDTLARFEPFHLPDTRPSSVPLSKPPFPVKSWPQAGRALGLSLRRLIHLNSQMAGNVVKMKVRYLTFPMFNGRGGGSHNRLWGRSPHHGQTQLPL